MYISQTETIVIKITDIGCHGIYLRKCLIEIVGDNRSVVLNLIGDRQFLWSEPRNSIACHRTLFQRVWVQD